jgi:hypothetical protein
MIFPVLAICGWLTAIMSAAEMVPGSRRWTNPSRLLILVLVAFLAADALLFQDYDLGSFVAQGWPCLRAGVMVAVPTGIASWFALRRGFAVNPASAGLASGTLAGLAGLAMLELHCAIQLAPHIMFWHTAVIPVSALIGSLVARWLGSRRTFR